MQQEQIRKFKSKILLFGEYSIIENSRALALPFSLFDGYLAYENNVNVQHNNELWAFAESIQQKMDEGEFERTAFSFNLKDFRYDIKQGLTFKSTIPQGLGVGSSGALCAALVDRYGKFNTLEQNNFSYLMNIFASLESHFHGKSSGLDPLISFLDKTLLVTADKKILTVNIPTNNESNNQFFLLNTGISRRTEPLMNLFLEKCKNQKYLDFIHQKLCPLNNQCIEQFLKGQIEVLRTSFFQLSQFQLEYFLDMIPPLFRSMWKRGLETGEYALKLCGAGGGGFLLGMTNKIDKTFDSFHQYSIRQINLL